MRLKPSSLPGSGYLVAVLATAGVAAFRVALQPFLEDSLPFLFFPVAIAIAAWYGGLGPGLAATLLSAAAAIYFFIPPYYSFRALDLPEWISIAVFGVTGFIISWLCELLHVTRRKLEHEERRLRRSVTARRGVEESLARSESAERQRALELEEMYATMPIGLAQLDRELRFLRINERLAEINGLPVAAHLGRTLSEVVPDLAPKVEAAFRRVLETGEPVLDVEVIGETAAAPGVERAWLESWFPLRDAAGRITGLNVIAQEITERRLAARRLGESEERFRVLVGALTSIVWVADATGAFDAPQETWSAYTGQSLEAYLGHGWTEAIHEADRASVRELWRQALASGETFRARGRLWHAPSRSWRHFEAVGAPVRNADGTIREWVGKFLDVEERWRAREELRRVSEELQIVTDTMDAPVTRCGKDLVYRWVNRHYAEWLERKPEEIVGRSIEEVIGEAAMRRLRPHFERVLRGEVVRYEDQVDFRGIGRRWIQAVYTPTFDPAGGVDGWVAVVVDIQARKEAEDELRLADARKERFLATLAHELRNPLAPLRNALEILKHPGATAATSEAARATMERQLSHAVRLVDDLLDVSRINRDTLELRLEPCDLAAVIAQAVETARPHVEGGNHRLDVSLPEKPVTLRADPVRLAQVLSNLIHNACKFSDPGQPVALSVHPSDGWVTISVRDQGIGFASEDRGRLFEMFTQLDPALSRSRGGLGVGLSIVRRLVEMHGGRVEATSDGPGRGSEFRVSLPENALSTSAAAPFLRIPPKAPAAARRILVVDDNADSASSLAALLELSGNVVRMAHDGLDAVHQTREFAPDVVLLDIGLPGIDGYEAARRIRSLPRGRGILLVAVTGWGQSEDRQRSREAGFDHHMVKPLRASALETLLANFSAATETYERGGDVAPTT